MNFLGTQPAEPATTILIAVLFVVLGLDRPFPYFDTPAVRANVVAGNAEQRFAAATLAMCSKRHHINDADRCVDLAEVEAGVTRMRPSIFLGATAFS